MFIPTLIGMSEVVAVSRGDAMQCVCNNSSSLDGVKSESLVKRKSGLKCQIHPVRLLNST